MRVVVLPSRLQGWARRRRRPLPAAAEARLARRRQGQGQARSWKPAPCPSPALLLTATRAPLPPQGTQQRCLEHQTFPSGCRKLTLHPRFPSSLDRSPPADERETREEREERRRRDEIREERRRERERERRLEELNAHGGKRSKITRDRDRDVSERVALGQANTGARSAEAMYDQRLFNQDQGLDSGFAGDDSYNTYSKPLFADRGNANLYRPTKAGDDELYGEKDDDPSKALRTDKFRPDKARIHGCCHADKGTETRK